MEAKYLLPKFGVNPVNDLEEDGFYVQTTDDRLPHHDNRSAE